MSDTFTCIKCGEIFEQESRDKDARDYECLIICDECFEIAMEKMEPPLEDTQ